MTANCIHLFRVDREGVARGWSAADARIRDTDTIHWATLPSVTVRGLAPCMYVRTIAASNDTLHERRWYDSSGKILALNHCPTEFSSRSLKLLNCGNIDLISFTWDVYNLKFHSGSLYKFISIEIRIYHEI